ncbi:hypothetical protein [Parendozoicomonas haliclonae]|uniref:hypothetical protein n=1 Tax=Parendozoicomonas haliclonae TaxID=1960125 RepID=UPI000B35E3AC|nr:hypothetical protein [Parendozoicomonas haliclonae]
MTVLFSFQARAVSPETQKIYDLSGLEQQFAFLSHTFTQEGLRMGRNELPDNDMNRVMLERLEAGLQKKYAPEKLRMAVLKVLNQELDATMTATIISMMEGAVWRRAVELEKRANDPANQKELEKYVSVRLQSELPRQVRLDLIRELVDRSQAVDLTTELMISGSLGAAGILMGEGEIPPQFEEGIRQQMTGMRSEYEEMVIRQFLYTYRYMSDEQLREYVSYYRTPAVQNLNKAVSLALTEAMR